MTNPFDDPDAGFLALVNEEGQHSLWPVLVEVPGGWQVAFGEAGRQERLDHIESAWTDLWPRSLVAALEK